MSAQISLFTPIKLGSLELPNRIVMAPMTRNRAAEGDVPSDLIAEHYAQRASAGLIITEGSQVSQQGQGYPATPGIYTPQQVTGWRKVTDAVHAKDGHIFIQLWHVGRISHPSLQPEGALPVAPSAIKPAGEAVTYQGMQPFVEPHALELSEIPGIVEQFRVAAHNAKAAGFDGVEIHAANGYLLDQFLRDGTNHRDDEYGGALENRVRLLLEVIDAVSEAWETASIGVRISPENSFNDIHDSDPQNTFNYVAEHLSPLALAYLHVVEGEMMQGTKKLDYRQIRDRFSGIYMANCGYTLEKAQAALQAGNVDMVSFGALYIANPDLVERFARKAPLNKPDPETYYGGDAHGYTDYPFLEEEEALA